MHSRSPPTFMWFEPATATATATSTATATATSFSLSLSLSLTPALALSHSRAPIIPLSTPPPAAFTYAGTHAFFDLVGKNGSMTWTSANLMPVVPMYDRNTNWTLNAVFFATPWMQQSLLPPASNQWE